MMTAKDAKKAAAYPSHHAARKNDQTRDAIFFIGAISFTDWLTRQ
jgi:hypothetical protein